MRRKLYFVFYRLIKCYKLAFLLSLLVYYYKNILYALRNLFNHKKTIDMKLGDARMIVNEYHPKSVSTFSYNDLEVENTIDLSIIVPVYNVAKYLEDCIVSILNQKTEYYFEVIFINDGSTDGSKDILEKHANKENILIINQDNAGLSQARNIGIDKARGKYIMFIDSDDIVMDSIVEELLNEAYRTGSDIVGCGYYTFGDARIKKDYINYPTLKNANSNKIIMQYEGFAWGKVFRRELWNNLRFPRNYWFEDTMIKFALVRLGNSFTYCPKVLYGYRYNEEGINNKASKSRKTVDTYWIVEDLVKLSLDMKIGDGQSLYLVTLMHLGATLVSRISNIDEDVKEAIFVLACNLVEEIKPKGKYRLPYMYGQLENAFENKDFAKWKLVSEYM